MTNTFTNSYEYFLVNLVESQGDTSFESSSYDPNTSSLDTSDFVVAEGTDLVRISMFIHFPKYIQAKYWYYSGELIHSVLILQQYIKICGKFVNIHINEFYNNIHFYSGNSNGEHLTWSSRLVARRVEKNSK